MAAHHFSLHARAIKVKENCSMAGSTSLSFFLMRSIMLLMVCKQNTNLGSRYLTELKINKPAMSFEDETFLKIMQAEFHQDEQKTGSLLCHSGHPDHPSQIIGNKLCLALILCVARWVETLRWRNSFLLSWRNSFRTTMQKEHHLSTRMKNVGTYPSSECIIRKNQDKYGWCLIPARNTKVFLWTMCSSQALT